MSLGDRLRQRRQEMGFTRPQLAAKICVTPSAIANYENGISTPKPDILISLINVVEVDALSLIHIYYPVMVQCILSKLIFIWFDCIHGGSPPCYISVDLL